MDMKRRALLLGVALVAGCMSAPKGPSVVARHKFGDESHTVRAHVLPDGSFSGTTALLSIHGTLRGPLDNGLYSVAFAIRSVWNQPSMGAQTNTVDSDLMLYPNTEVTMGGMLVGEESHSYHIRVETEGPSNRMASD